MCQLRLDFETFVMNNPVTVTTVTVGPSTAAAGSELLKGFFKILRVEMLKYPYLDRFLYESAN